MASDMDTNISGAAAPHSEAPLGDVILKTEGLTKHYGGVHALEDANFEIRRGEHVAIMGDNGAGKSTFVRQITAVEQRTRGKIWFNGQEVQFEGPLEAREAGIETVFQTLALADDLNVPDNLFLGREKTKWDWLGPFRLLDYRAMREATLAGLEKTAVKIPNINNSIRNMSGGQRQCVAIARTATFHSKLTIMDEPTAGLDPNQVLEVRKTIKGLGKTILLSTHILQEVRNVADRILLINQGRLVFSGTPEDLRDEPSLDDWFNAQTQSAA